MNSRQENRSKHAFTARIITKCSLQRFLSICGEKMSKNVFKVVKGYIKPDSWSDQIVSNPTNVHKLRSTSLN